MQAEPTDTPVAKSDATNADEQLFSQWASKRLTFYQAMEQQAQTSVAQILQMASEFTMRMEEESSQLLTRYRQEREAQQTQLAALQREMDELHATMAQEQQAHTEQLANLRQQEEARIDQRRQQASAEIEKQLVDANTKQAQLLSKAYTERDQVVAETRRLSGRLAELQQALQGLLGVTAAVSEPQQPASAAAPATTRLYQETIAAPEPAPAPINTAAETAQKLPATATPAASAAPEHTGTRLTIEAVKSFTAASDLIDRLEQSKAIKEVTLLQYEEETLSLSIQHDPDSSIETILQNEFSQELEFIEANAEVIKLRSRLDT